MMAAAMTGMTMPTAARCLPAQFPGLDAIGPRAPYRRSCPAEAVQRAKGPGRTT
jgi:hypothetical protein